MVRFKFQLDQGFIQLMKKHHQNKYPITIITHDSKYPGQIVHLTHKDINLDLAFLGNFFCSYLEYTT